MTDLSREAQLEAEIDGLRRENDHLKARLCCYEGQRTIPAPAPLSECPETLRSADLDEFVWVNDQ